MLAGRAWQRRRRHLDGRQGIGIGGPVVQNIECVGFPDRMAAVCVGCVGGDICTRWRVPHASGTKRAGGAALRPPLRRSAGCRVGPGVGWCVLPAELVNGGDQGGSQGGEGRSLH